MPSALHSPNPLAARLIKRAGFLAKKPAAIVAAVLGLWASAILLTDTIVPYQSGVTCLLYYSAFALLIGSTLALPLFVTSLAANLTVRYACSPEYPILCTTSLSDGRIVRGYVLAALRHSRAPLILTISLLPAAEIMLANLIGVFAGRYSQSWAVYTGTWAMIDLGTVGIVLKHAIAIAGLGLGLCSISLLGIALGTGIGLWWRSPHFAAPAAITALVGMALGISFVVNTAVNKIRIPDVFLRHTLKYALLALVSFLIALSCMRLAQHWARKPGW